MDDVSYQSPIIEGRRRRSSKKKIIVIIIILLILVPVGIWSFRFFAGVSQQKPIPTPTVMPTTIAFPTDTPTPTAVATPTAALSPVPTVKKTTDTKTGINRATIRVLVENGSGTVGAANKAALLLKDAGYTVAGTKNADNYDYQDVTISVKTANTAALSLLKQDLSSEYVVSATNTNLDASSAADAVVIIGK